MAVELERDMEERLIHQLTMGKSQWTYRPDLRTEADLWGNFKRILETNNLAALDGVSLTPQEFMQVQNQLNFSSFYQAAVWLRGENGIAQVSVQREDASRGTIRLNVLNSREIAGGTSTYEVINQFQAAKGDRTGRDRRLDVSLLINGIPLIQIELKQRTAPFMDAFRQIKKYLAENKFTGLFSAVQMFVVSNGTDTRYIAAAASEKLNEAFLTRWVDPQNRPVNNYLEFAAAALTIPEAHQLIAQHTVLDTENRNLILLRPYQIHAIEAVKEATRTQQSGYVWHTTGSGKTLTSFKVARNLLQIPSIDKTIFIVDRIDLDQQTTAAFLAYAEHDLIEIDQTSSVSNLINKLKGPERTVIVTTIQKLNLVMKRAAENSGHKDFARIRGLHLAFVVDECHRAVTPQKQQELQRFFSSSLWFGFTGTPIFKENAKAILGDLARTTEQQYGPSHHEYTVREAIHDKAVLGFQVEYKSTITEEELNGVIRQLYPSLEPETMLPEDRESRLPTDVYDTDEHRYKVIDSIINESQQKLGLNKGPGKSYTALLTASSIREAQRYYELFQLVRAGKAPVRISPSVQSKISDFPKVAITYSISENEKRSIQDQQRMARSIQDYNQLFGTSFTLETERAYNQDLNNRLARKKDRFLVRKEQLDIVIVVDRLLTGYDAPCLSTLFMDRMPLPPHTLIQAFSRTNRLFDRQKQYGQIVTFRVPTLFKQAVDAAFTLYSNGGENDVLAPSWAEALVSFKSALAFLKSVAPVPSAVSDRDSTEVLKQFAKSFQAFDKAYASIKVYSEYEEGVFEEHFQLSEAELEEYRGIYENVIEELRRRQGDDPDPIELDINYQLQSVHTDEIDYEYIIRLMQTHVLSSQPEELIPPAEKSDIEKYLAEFKQNRPQLGELLEAVWQDIQTNPDTYRNQKIMTVIEERISRQEQALIESFAQEWAVKPDDLGFVVYNYSPHKDALQLGEKELLHNADFESYRAQSDNPVSKLRYRSEIRQSYKDMVEAKILPYRWN